MYKEIRILLLITNVTLPSLIIIINVFLNQREFSLLLIFDILLREEIFFID